MATIISNLVDWPFLDQTGRLCSHVRWLWCIVQYFQACIVSWFPPLKEYNWTIKNGKHSTMFCVLDHPSFWQLPAQSYIFQRRFKINCVYSVMSRSLSLKIESIKSVIIDCYRRIVCVCINTPIFPWWSQVTIPQFFYLWDGTTQCWMMEPHLLGDNCSRKGYLQWGNLSGTWWKWREKK